MTKTKAAATKAKLQHNAFMARSVKEAKRLSAQVAARAQFATEAATPGQAWAEWKAVAIHVQQLERLWAKIVLEQARPQ